MSIEAYTANLRQGKVSNYDTAMRLAAAEFAKVDISQAVKRFSLKKDNDYIYTKLFCENYRIRHCDGLVERIGVDNSFPAGFEVSMTLYDLLTFPDCKEPPSSEFTLLHNLSTVHNTSSYAGNGVFAFEEALFDQHPDKLVQACNRSGGLPFGKGDISYKIPMFNELSVVCSFWKSDEEFPPKLTLMFPKNTTHFMHYETVWYAASALLELIKTLGQF